MNETKRGPKPVSPKAVQAWARTRKGLSHGTIKKLAGHLRVTAPAVSKWPYVPRERLPEVASFLGVEPSALRPDLFPHPNPWDELLPSNTKGL